MAITNDEIIKSQLDRMRDTITMTLSARRRILGAHEGGIQPDDFASMLRALESCQNIEKEATEIFRRIVEKMPDRQCHTPAEAQHEMCHLWAQVVRWCCQHLENCDRMRTPPVKD